MNLIERAKGMILAPATEWQAVAAEQATAKDLYVGYNAPLAAIGPVASLIGLMVFGLGMPFVGGLRFSLSALLAQSAVGFVLALVAVFLVALVIDALAPGFGAQKSSSQALKVASYASTPAWLAGILNLLPSLGMLSILASLYGVYLVYLGLQSVMKAPKDKAVGYTVAVVIAVFVIMMVVSAIVGRIGMGIH